MSGAMADVQYIHLLSSFVDSVNNPVNVRFPSVEEVPQRLVFRSDWTAERTQFEAQDSLAESRKPAVRCMGFSGVNFFVQDRKIAFSARCDPNEKGHGSLQIRRRTQ